MSRDKSRVRIAPLEIDPEEFRRVGHRLVDNISEHLGEIRDLPVTRGYPPTKIRAAIGARELPPTGQSPAEILEQAYDLLSGNSLFNGHPRFWGYITSSAAPIGALADMLASAINANTGAWELAPVATEVEKLVIEWIAELIGYPPDCGGVLVSGGNMANIVGLMVGRYHGLGPEVRESGMRAMPEIAVYGSAATHMWLQKAADMIGIGTRAIRWIEVDSGQRMVASTLARKIREDISAGVKPLMVVATAGTVGTGAVDPIGEIAAICNENVVWLHVDGAYGAPAAVLDDVPADLKLLGLANSVAVDPHKWLYAPVEAGCVLVRDAEVMRATFAYHPSYYKFGMIAGEETDSLVHYSPQNSRGFKALKVWLAFKQVGRSGYAEMIEEDIDLARYMFDLAEKNEELEAMTQSLSITTFRFVPDDEEARQDEEYLKELNQELLTRLQEGGEAFLSHVFVGEKYALRLCVVNFRTSHTDIAALPAIIVRLGREIHAERSAGS